MSGRITDGAVLAHIQDLVTEEEALYARGNLSDVDRDRLKAIAVELDRAWDLLRQRRALREFGANPDEARERHAAVVEKYTG
jgi:hypothetical protein